MMTWAKTRFNILKLNQTYRALSITLIKHTNKVCWNCKKSTTELFCQSCNSLQKPNLNENYFKIMGINEEFRINEAALAKKFKNLQKQLHPDRFSNKTTTEQAISEDYSSLVNKAYTTLLNPFARGTYILISKGYELPEKTDLESSFLHEIMELNEEVEDADTSEEILRIEKQNKETLKDLQNELDQALKAANYESAIKTLVKMKYYISLDDQIKNVIRDMGIVR